MNELIKGIGTDLYWAEFQKIPFRLPEQLLEFGPIPRLQMAFNLINEKYSELPKIKLTLAIQMMKDLSFIIDLSMLGQLDLGDRGAGVFENFYRSVPQRNLCW